MSAVQHIAFAYSEGATYPLLELVAVELWPTGPRSYVVRAFALDGDDYDRTATDCPRMAEMLWLQATGGCEIRLVEDAS